jgi:hypothetical protein
LAFGQQKLRTASPGTTRPTLNLNATRPVVLAGITFFALRTLGARLFKNKDFRRSLRHCVLFRRFEGGLHGPPYSSLRRLLRRLEFLL